MRVAIRTDSSHLIGSGHLMRCLTLADLLVKEGCEVRFVCRDLPGSLHQLVTGRSLELKLLPAPSSYGDAKIESNNYQAWLGCSQDTDAAQTVEAISSEQPPDWLIVDHYGLDSTWQNRTREASLRLMVIDDLANRQHECDVLLDQNYYANLSDRYQKLVPPGCRCLLGPEYALLRPEFYDARAALTTRDGLIRRVLVFLGGYDQTNETAKALKGIELLSGSKIECTAVVGANNPHAEELRQQHDGVNGVRILTQVNNMAELMVNSNVSIGGGGTTTWERCLLGLPTMTIELADNQRIMLNDLAAYGVVWHLGSHDSVTPDLIAKQFDRLLSNAGEVRQVSERCLSLMGQTATAGRHPVVQELIS